MVIGEEQVRFTRQLLLLWLKVLLFHSGWSSFVLSQSHANPEVMIPLKILDSAPSKKPSEWVSYRMKFDGQEQVVHMTVTKFLLARNMPVFTYTDQGVLSQDHPFIHNNCYYYGYVQGDLLSQVSLNSCFGGFNGILQKNNTVYKVEPKLNSTTFEHLVYKLVSEKNDLPARRCGSIDHESQCEFKITKSDQLYTSKQSGFEGWWLHKRYLTIVSVVDNNLYRHTQSNTTLTNDRVLSLFNIVIANFRQLDLTITLVGIEIWTDKNHIDYLPSTKHVIPFCSWKEKTLNLRTSHQLAYLFAMIPGEASVYFVFVHSICTMSTNCANIVIKAHHPMERSALITTRAVAINVGIKLDERYCACGQDYCIMNKQLPNRAHLFSNCSYGQYYQANTHCLLRLPDTEVALEEKRCGNGKLEEGEDCDCGTINSCANDPCCEANCKLAPGAICASGLCCRNCKFLPAGTLCRKKENQCDLPEWCNGTYHECPQDVYVQSGIPCKGGGYCYGKRCKNRQEQCRRIFGQQAKSARVSCYVDVNKKGDRFGNCAYYTSSYTPCAIKDSLCGRLQCENVNSIDLLQSHSTFISTNISGVICWGIDYHFGAHTPDLGEVEEGTECGENSFCVDRRCLPVSYFTNRCSPEKCRMHGICNNRHHCHCESPWRPPFCYEAGKVGGGSVDSGPPSGSHQDGGDSTESEDSTQSEGVKHSHICYFLLLLRFMVFLLIFIGIMLKAMI
ncbi:disintegrin and metalloproteinase domain-containing protein 29-like [Suncus etruscus]|uniref:disintegrin and metalloproteinase domain-containing protein 29-like n=1 Tax=Suncus etruscus TaxID=109475 RepID=UPI00210F66B9|nr:disintegrin and metalloproteinase domain-containing protein 29-like [Suncus etruscus]